MRLYWNPFKCYAMTCVVVLAVYFLGFSDLYPKLDWDVFVFLLITGVASALLSWDVANIRIRQKADTVFRHDISIAIAIAIGFVLEIIYAGVVPIISSSGGGDYDYRDFGIPTFHVVLVGICFFYSIYWWDLYLQGNGKGYAWIAFSGVFWAFVIVNRGAILISLISFLFAYGNRIGLRRRVWYIASFVILVIWGFGVVGEIRTQAMGIDSEDLILKIGDASDQFMGSGIPKNFFWFYLYASSPLANLQNTANNIPNNILPFVGVMVDFLPDFISKRIITEEQMGVIWPQLITPQLTVATAYGRPLMTLGWLGPYLLHFYFLATCSLLIRYVRRSRYGGALVALWCAQGCLMFFDNMIVFSGAVGQVLVGLVLVFFESHKINLIRRSCRLRKVVEL